MVAASLSMENCKFSMGQPKKLAKVDGSMARIANIKGYVYLELLVLACYNESMFHLLIMAMQQLVKILENTMKAKPGK